MTTAPHTAPWQRLDATQLKLLAAALMFFDHIHQMFAASGAPLWLTALGRPVFPLFLFAAAEGFHHTHSKSAYLKRLLVASWCMTLLTFALQRLFPNPDIVLMNNAFSTFFVAGVFMLSADWIRDGITQHAPRQILKGVALALVPFLCTAPMFLVAQLSFNEHIPAATIRTLAMVALLVPSVLTAEGGIAMVALGLVFYLLRRHRALQIAALLALSLLVWLTGDSLQALMALAALPIACYNGQRGRGWKNFFYIFYPAHIAALYLLATILHG